MKTILGLCLCYIATLLQTQSWVVMGYSCHLLLLSLCGVMLALWVRPRAGLFWLVVFGVLDALLTSMPAGLGLAWAGLVALCFFTPQQGITSLPAQSLLVRSSLALLLRQGLWFGYGLYQNQILSTLPEIACDSAITIGLLMCGFIFITGSLQLVGMQQRPAYDH
jgi:hypothetical protein